MGLTQEQLAARLAFDYRITLALKAPCLGEIRAFPDESAFAAQKPIKKEEQVSRARLYRVDYRIQTLSGPGQFIDGCTVKFDLLAGGNYPFSSPVATVISRPTPWSPHFHSGGPVCLGSGWSEARGKMLFPQLIIHVAKLLNFDEPGHGPNYVGYTPEATRYWHKEYQGRPLNPHLVYPELSLDLIHGEKKPCHFSPAKSQRFAPSENAPKQRALFIPLSSTKSPLQTTKPVTFRPNSIEVNK